MHQFHSFAFIVLRRAQINLIPRWTGKETINHGYPNTGQDSSS